jgi:hypothetical protein
MLMRIKHLIRWLASLATVSPEDMKLAGVHLGRLRD